jgi:hypothetical protein
MKLTQREAVEVFLTKIAVHLDEKHEFSPEDLHKIANGFIEAAQQKERQCSPPKKTV